MARMVAGFPHGFSWAAYALAPPPGAHYL